MITDESLMAYADGELSDEERALVDAALLEDGRVQGVLAEEWRLRRSLLALYDPALEEEIPDRLKRLLEPPGASLHSIGPQPSPARRSWWWNVTAIAAALVLGILLGQVIDTESASPVGETAHAIGSELDQALEVQLASTQSSSAPIQIGISFIGPGGAPCRTYRTRNAVGLACREDGRWAMRLLAPFEPSGAFEYQKAETASALVMQSAQELMAGEPMDAVEERSARDSGWVAGAR